MANCLTVLKTLQPHSYGSAQFLSAVNSVLNSYTPEWFGEQTDLGFAPGFGQGSRTKGYLRFGG